MKLVLVVVAPLALCACAGSPIARERQAQVTYEQSVTDYRECLAANPNNVKACEAKRASMEAQERYWSDLRCSLPGHEATASCLNTRATVTLENRPQ